MKFSELFSFLKKKDSSENSSPEGDQDVFQQEYAKRKKFSPNVPGWARLDWFAKKDLGTMKPPDELLEDFVPEKKKPDKPKKPAPDSAPQRKVSRSSKSLKPRASNQEIDSFLDDFLTPSDPPPEKK